MKCTRPQNTKEGMKIPCGRCIACRVNRTQEWKMRLVHEFDFWSDGYFVTLTYNDENMPLNGSLVKGHLQNWVKRIRNDSEKLVYYGVGEYGDKFKRPHYHVIVMGNNLNVRGNWNYGFEYYGSVRNDSINYVCGYIQKKLYGVRAKEEYGKRLAPFSLMSKGLGLRWVEVNKDQLLMHNAVREHGKNMRIPRYYVKKIKDDLPIEIVNERSIIESERRDSEADARKLSWAERIEAERSNLHQLEIDLQWRELNANKKDFGL